MKKILLHLRTPSMKTLQLFVLLLVACAAQMANAASSYTWNVASGNWSASGSWTPSGPPGSADTAIFGVNDTTSSQTTVNNIVDASFAGTITALTYNQTASGPGTGPQTPLNTMLTVSGTTTVGGGTANGNVTSVAMTGAGKFAANGNLTIGNTGSSL